MTTVMEALKKLDETVPAPDNKITGEKKTFWCVCEFCKGNLCQVKDVYCPPSICDWTADVHYVRYRLDVLGKILFDEQAKLEKRLHELENTVSNHVNEKKD